MNAILIVASSEEGVHLAQMGEGMEVEQSLDQLVEKASSLAQRILANNATYSAYKEELLGYTSQIHYRRAACHNQCETLLAKTKQLIDTRNAQQDERISLAQEFRRLKQRDIAIVAGNDSVMNVWHKCNQIRNFLFTEDDLEKVDESLPQKMRRGTYDACYYLANPTENCNGPNVYGGCVEGVINVFRTIVSIPLSLVCNSYCCGAQDMRIHQLERIIRDGLGVPSDTGAAI
jgi:hypothetical protein